MQTFYPDDLWPRYGNRFYQISPPFACLRTWTGVIKSYKLTYEPATVQHAVFDRTRTINQWAIEAKFLRGIVDHFSPSAEQLDIYSDGNGKAIFTSFTTKITDGKGLTIAGFLKKRALTCLYRNTQTTHPHFGGH